MSIFTWVETEFKDADNSFDAWWNSNAKPFLKDDVEPALKAFIKQFATPLGQQALSIALGLAASLATPGAAFGAIAAQAVPTLIKDAEGDLAVAAQTGLQTMQSALQVAKVATGTITPNDVATAQAASTTIATPSA